MAGMATPAVGISDRSKPADAAGIPPGRLSPAPEWQEGQLTPRQTLRLASGLTAAQADLLDRIITCESGWRPGAKNPVGTSSGLAQFLDSTWRSTRRAMGKPDDALKLKPDPYEQIRTMVWLYRHTGTSPWNESSTCWHRPK